MKPCLLYVGTSDGLVVLRVRADGQVDGVGHAAHGNAVRGIAVRPDDPRVAYVACGLRGWGLHRTRDAGGTSELVGFADLWVWDVLFDPRDPNTLWVGTEPPMVYVSYDEGRTFRALDGVERLPSRPRWFFFYEPFPAGHVHGFALHSERPERLFAGVEHGALIYTHDGGATWQEALVGHDLHRVAVDPLDPDRVLAGTGEGLFVSSDAGRSWDAVPYFSGRYVHGVVFSPHRPAQLFVYAATEGNPLHRSEDRGTHWRPIGSGLPANGPADPLAVHPEEPNVLFYAGEEPKGRGQLFVSADGGGTWERVNFALPKVWRLRAAGEQDAQ